ncbi:Hypothetical predicted protein [Cloeon dipterum]|uniref:Ig-like domain-containing protein n=1 Tax=Cloeon dipterum TaxID=197152 RepID=A0A8S1CAY7_9INSE|nr:Hypothetical predicted protein [Cloeon dipterum]
MVNVRATANGKPPLDDVRVIEPRPSRTKQPPTTGLCQLAVPYLVVSSPPVDEEGTAVRFQCAIAGHPTPWVTWDTDGLILTPSRRLTINDTEQLVAWERLRASFDWQTAQLTLVVCGGCEEEDGARHSLHNCACMVGCWRWHTGSLSLDSLVFTSLVRLQQRLEDDVLVCSRD